MPLLALVLVRLAEGVEATAEELDDGELAPPLQVEHVRDNSRRVALRMLPAERLLLGQLHHARHQPEQHRAAKGGVAYEDAGEGVGEFVGLVDETRDLVGEMARRRREQAADDDKPRHPRYVEPDRLRRPPIKVAARVGGAAKALAHVRGDREAPR